MPSWDHPFVMLLAGAITLVIAFPVARYFFEDFETFKEELGLTRKWEREMWLLGGFPTSASFAGRLVAFALVLVVVFLAFHSLGLRIVGDA